MEVSALKANSLPGLRGPSPLLRLQSDERLIAFVRRGHNAAFETLVSRYQSRLLAFCRHMLGSREDAEDVLQEVFAAAFNAILADEREINVRPWLYRIARNRSLNHLRRASAIGVDSMDVHYADGGLSTGEKVLRREAFRQLIADVKDLPETQRTALLLREIDALSYEQIAEAMETTIPSVKSLLVRARISLAEAAEARKLSCTEVREHLGEAAEGLAKLEAPVRRHLRSCERCRAFRKQLKANNTALAAVMPIGALAIAKKLLLSKLSAGAGHVAGGAGGAAAAGGGTVMSSLATAGTGAIATKAVAGLAAAALVTAGAVEVERKTPTQRPSRPIAASTQPDARAASAIPELLRAVALPRTAVGDAAVGPHGSTAAAGKAHSRSAAAHGQAGKHGAKADETAKLADRTSSTDTSETSVAASASAVGVVTPSSSNAGVAGAVTEVVSETTTLAPERGFSQATEPPVAVGSGTATTTAQEGADETGASSTGTTPAEAADGGEETASGDDGTVGGSTPGGNEPAPGSGTSGSGTGTSGSGTGTPGSGSGTTGSGTTGTGTTGTGTSGPGASGGSGTVDPGSGTTTTGSGTTGSGTSATGTGTSAAGSGTSTTGSGTSSSDKGTATSDEGALDSPSVSDSKTSSSTGEGSGESVASHSAPPQARVKALRVSRSPRSDRRLRLSSSRSPSGGVQAPSQRTPAFR